MPVHTLPRRWPPRARGRSLRGQPGNWNYFSFAIDSRNRSRYVDGLAFFLALVGSKIPDDTTKGSTLGLRRRHGPGHRQEGKALPQLSLPPRLCPYPWSSGCSGHCQLLLDATTSSAANASSSSSVPLPLYSDLIVNSDPDIRSALEKCQLKDTQRELARLDNEMRGLGSSTPVTIDSAADLKEKELLIAKIEMEIAELTQQRDIAQSKVQEMLQAKQYELLNPEEHSIVEAMTDQAKLHNTPLISNLTQHFT
ncbi:hypothetical protein MLD38_037460 [Melastoma candidum]|uniref:Uncharacterized protein n=1 Tax=Melastoma candidum TaxID=119954 RepID=A0ACB9LNY7_9MYRT|nr:hypothetical protein MLD38_037460 [Melastoma candidum]